MKLLLVYADDWFRCFRSDVDAEEVVRKWLIENYDEWANGELDDAVHSVMMGSRWFDIYVEEKELE